MRRLLSWLIMAPALAAVAVFALNNKTPVALDLWPFGLEVEMPVYLALLLALGAGALLGGVAAWLGQGRVRSKLREQVYEGEVARRELRAEQDKAAALESELAHKAAETQERAQAPAVPPTPLQETLPPPAA